MNHCSSEVMTNKKVTELDAEYKTQANARMDALEKGFGELKEGFGSLKPEHSNPQSYMYFSFLYIMVAILTLLLGVVRLMFRENPSLFNEHGRVFTIMIIASGATAVSASGILILASYLLKSWMNDIHYTILKTIGSFSALVLAFSLGAVIYVPSGDLNWIAYTLLCVTFCGLLSLYSFFWKGACAYQQEEYFNTYPVHWSFLLIILVPFSFILVPMFVPSPWWAVICVSFSFMVSSFIAFVMFTGRAKVEQDKTVDHPWF